MLWSLPPRIARALPPPQLLSFLPAATISGFLTRPSWARSPPARRARAYLDGLATPRDAVVLHTLCAVTTGVAGAGVTVEPDSPLGGSAACSSSAISAFLSGSSACVVSLFSDGALGVTRGPTPADADLLSPHVADALTAAAAATTSMGAAAAAPLRVTCARIVDACLVWDSSAAPAGSSAAEEEAEEARGSRAADDAWRAKGEHIAGRSTVAFSPVPRSRWFSRIISTYLHQHQLRPPRRVAGQVTVAYTTTSATATTAASDLALHTVTWEASLRRQQGDSAWDKLLDRLPWLRPLSSDDLEVARGWRIVDIDGRFATASTVPDEDRVLSLPVITPGLSPLLRYAYGGSDRLFRSVERDMRAAIDAGSNVAERLSLRDNLDGCKALEAAVQSLRDAISASSELREAILDVSVAGKGAAEGASPNLAPSSSQAASFALAMADGAAIRAAAVAAGILGDTETATPPTMTPLEEALDRILLVLRDACAAADEVLHAETRPPWARRVEAEEAEEKANSTPATRVERSLAVHALRLSLAAALDDAIVNRPFLWRFYFGSRSRLKQSSGEVSVRSIDAQLEHILALGGILAAGPAVSDAIEQVIARRKVTNPAAAGLVHLAASVAVTRADFLGAAELCSPALFEARITNQLRGVSADAKLKQRRAVQPPDESSDEEEEGEGEGDISAEFRKANAQLAKAVAALAAVVTKL